MQVQRLKDIDKTFRQFGIEGEDTFKMISAHYLNAHKPKVVTKEMKMFWNEGLELLEVLKKDRVARQTLELILKNDLYGQNLPTIYQYFLTKRFRDLSGKFFTPHDLAKIMTSMLPIKNGAVVYDPTCGGGTFLLEASRRWVDKRCTLIGNDIDKLLIVLAEIVLLLNKQPEHSLKLTHSNIYNSTNDSDSINAKVDFILANPPFSISVDSFKTRSKLFDKGYRNSDALFLDFCLKVLKPGGHLVCLLPHSIIANREFEKLRLTIEEDWEIAAVIVMPEGTFNETSNTTTRADILHLRKRSSKKLVSKILFGNISDISDVITNNNDFKHFNDLSMLLEELGVGFNEN